MIPNTQIWFNALFCQLIVFLLSTIVAIYLLKLPFKYALFSIILVMPTPLFSISPGSAGFIYPGDLFALLCLYLLIRDKFNTDKYPILRTTLFKLSISLLIVIPMISTLLAFPKGINNWKMVLLSFARGFEYLAVFCVGSHYITQITNPAKILLSQMFAWFLLCLCGFAAYNRIIELDAWNDVRGLIDSITEYEREVSDGFMGMYRGTIGVYNVVFLAIASSLLLRNTRGLISFITLSLASTYVVFSSGSRQGLFIGFIAIIIGLLLSSLSEKKRALRLKLVFNAACFIIISVIAIFAVFSILPDDIKENAENRFVQYFEIESLLEGTRNRDPRWADAYESCFYDTPTFLFGRGIGSIVDGASAPHHSEYVDSEILMQFQTNGLFGVLIYIAYILYLMKTFLHIRKSKKPFQKKYTIAVTSVLISGIFLTYGHFFLITTMSCNASAGLLLWAMTGSAVGIYCFEKQYMSIIGSKYL